MCEPCNVMLSLNGHSTTVWWRAWKQGITVHHRDGNLIYGSVIQSSEADVARPRMWCLWWGGESEESNDGRDEAPMRCVFAVATARQLARVRIWFHSVR